MPLCECVSLQCCCYGSVIIEMALDTHVTAEYVLVQAVSDGCYGDEDLSLHV